MAVKFSQFTTRTGTLDASTMIVGYDDPAGTKTNVEISLATLKANLDNIYTSDGTIGTTRVVGITDTLTFEESSGNVDMFNMNVNGAMFLGLGAANTANSNVVIGVGAGANAAGGYGFGNYHCVLIGANAYSNSSYNENVGVGKGVYTGNHGVAIGSGAVATNNSVSIGFQAGYQSMVTPHSSTTKGINIGKYTKGEGTNNIVLNSTGSNVAPSTANAFGVYMSSSSTPDFVVIGGGESTLNTNLKITGQAYTELHTGATIDGIDWSSGNVQEVTLPSGSSDFDPSNAKAGATYILKITQPSGGDGTINWDNIGAANIKWPGGTEPTLTATNAAVDIVTLICTDATGQGVYYANATLNFS
jgi:hypothetical protein